MSAVDKPVKHNVTSWITGNEQYFKPPVCNKMMHGDGQMKLFFVGGPNQRKDYHVECGEELFYQLKGEMLLKVVEKGKHKDIPIREGEMFLLPGCIQHSPNRPNLDSVGLVIERERHRDTEKDGLRYFVEEDGVATTDVLYEQWFYCSDLGKELVPIIKGYFASEQHKTGKALPGTISDTIPLTLDMERELQMPFSLADWMEDNSQKIDEQGRLEIFDCQKYQFQVYMYGGGEVTDKCDTAEAWVWQFTGKSSVTVEGTSHSMVKDDSLLVPCGQRFTVAQEVGSRALVCYQDPTKSATWPTTQD